MAPRIKTTQPAATKPSICTCVNLRRASRAITRIYDKALEPADIKITQYSVLANVARSGPLSVSKLARILKLDRTTLVRNLKSLEVAGFIENAPVTDPRERCLSITASGQAVVEKARPYWLAAQQQVEGHLGQAGLEQLVALVASLEKLCDDGNAGYEPPDADSL